jgi:serine/threonine-protein kinase HipA
VLTAAEHLERDQASEAELRRLLRGGGSLGGARPKAHMRDTAGRIGIAKFPSPATDDWDVIRWESVALDLARDAGVVVSDSALHVIDGKPVLIVDRFDRTDGHRLGYVSAMTMLEAGDGADGSYLDIADVIERNSPTASKDLEQLWRRVAFSILIRNTDDHLRNHGFLRTSTAGWSLSPAFDLNPDPRPDANFLSTAIDYGQREALIQTLMGVAEYFRLDEDEARMVLADVANATAQWETAARKAGLDRSALARMAPAFEHAQADAAGKIAAETQTRAH